MAQPCPACMHMKPKKASLVSRSASSRMMSADLPPSSRKSRLSVGAPAAMIRRPVAVEPVKEMRSTRGSTTSCSPTQMVRRRHHVDDPVGDVGLLGDQAADAGGRPRGVRRGLDHHGVAGGQGLAELVEEDLHRVIPRDDGADHTDGLLDHLLPALHAEGVVVGQRSLPLERVDVLGRPQQRLGQRRVELGHGGHHDGGADFGHELGPQELLLADDGVLELAQAALTEGAVGRPRRLVERPAGRDDGPVHVGSRGVGGLAQHLLGGRVDVVEGAAGGRFEQFAVDHHSELARGDPGGARIGRRHGATPR